MSVAGVGRGSWGCGIPSPWRCQFCSQSRFDCSLAQTSSNHHHHCFRFSGKKTLGSGTLYRLGLRVHDGSSAWGLQLQRHPGKTTDFQHLDIPGFCLSSDLSQNHLRIWKCGPFTVLPSSSGWGVKAADACRRSTRLSSEPLPEPAPPRCLLPPTPAQGSASVPCAPDDGGTVGLDGNAALARG